MSQNRLHLDFTLQYIDERSAFVNNYVSQPEFITHPLTSSELETIGNYILWGKDRATGLNAKQSKELQLDSKYGDWDANNQCDSLDALMESPTFNENQLSPTGANAHKTPKEKFSRTETLAQCPDSLRPDFLALFRMIDTLDLKINYYDLRHGKRIKEPRAELLAKFSVEEQSKMREDITHWNQYTYLKQRHNLIELRRQQYALRDSYIQPITKQQPTIINVAEPANFQTDIEVLPLGLREDNTIGRLVWRENIAPKDYNESQLKQISDFYWAKKSYTPGKNQVWVDFREEKHVYQLFNTFFELRDAADESDVGTDGLMRALMFYIDAADLTDLQHEILDMKLRKIRNSDIAFEINHKYGKSYTVNYISTIFTQKIIPKICEAARYHEQVISNLWFEEEFKQCSVCGKWFLRDAEHFTRKARSSDGFTNKCKKCEKIARGGKK